jgi:uncharacterized protein YndB with AHSA1/START domain
LPDIHLSLDIERPPKAVFELLADIAHYRRWLPPSKTYSETVDISDSSVKQGTTYLDRNSTNVLHGEVTAYQPHSQITFHQATPKPGLDVTVRYELSPTAEGTHLERTTSVRTGGILRLLQPIVVRRTRQENQRTLAALKAYLETQDA